MGENKLGGQVVVCVLDQCSPHSPTSSGLEGQPARVAGGVARGRPPPLLAVHDASPARGAGAGARRPGKHPSTRAILCGKGIGRDTKARQHTQ